MGEPEEGNAEERSWAPMRQPRCAAADRTLLRLEWPKYEDFVDGSEYCLELGFAQAPQAPPAKDHGRRSGRKTTEVVRFAVPCCEYFPQGFCSSAEGHCENFESLEWKPVYRGLENSCDVQDLMPGMGYVFRLRVLVPDSCPSGVPPPLFSNQVMFFTPPCAPCSPESPVLVDRGRTSLKVKWLPPVITGGLFISDYVVEMKRARGLEFEIIYSGSTDLSVKVTRLSPGTSYIFRVKACNSLGWSSFSKEVTYSTAPSVPAVPAPPVLLSSCRNSLSISWEEPENHGSPITSYTLEADDGFGGPFTIHYTGDERSFELTNLKSGACYKVRVVAHNSVGKGAFSTPAAFATLHSPPSAPRSISIHGRTSTTATIIWSPPDYDGGSPITGYELEFNLKAFGTRWVQAYAGQPNTYSLTGLRPGCQYRVRVKARNNEGFGHFSQDASFTTLPGLSEAPPPPQFSELESTSLKVLWNYPNHDGGHPVTGYRLEMLGAETDDPVCAYRGPDNFTLVSRLIPGEKYVFKVQAINKAGSSAWSGQSEIWTKAAIPDTPESPIPISVSSTSILLRWTMPKANGSSIILYRLQMATLGYNASLQNAILHPYVSGSEHYIVEKQNSEGPKEEDVKDEHRYAVQCIYDGPALEYTIRQLEPYTSYAFFLQVLNSVGESGSSKIVVCLTSPSSPAAPPPPVTTASSSDALVLQWEFPARDNGANVVSFTLHMQNEKTAQKRNVGHKQSYDSIVDEWTEIYSGSLLSYTVSSLLPGHAYTFRLTAYNEYGPSGSSYLTASTDAACPLPPGAPAFSGILPTSVRIRWSAPACENGAPISRYKLLVDQFKPGQLQKVYEGNSTSYRIVKLGPGRTYQAAVQAVNSAGESHPSERASVTLPEITLPALDAPQLSRSNDLLSVSWKPLELKTVVTYTLQMESAAGKLLQVYEGSTTRFETSGSAKNSRFRVRANAGSESGPWSPFSKWTLDAISRKQESVAKTKATNYYVTKLSAAGRDLPRGLMEPWSVKQRRLIALFGTFLTLGVAFYSQRG